MKHFNGRYAALASLDGQQVTMIGTYEPTHVSRRPPRPDAPPPTTVQIRAEHGSLMLGVYYEASGSRPEEERARFAGKAVRVTGTVWQATPTMYSEDGYPLQTMIGPYLDVTSIDVVDGSDLVAAATRGSRFETELVLDAGVDLDTRNDHGFDAFGLAMWGGHTELASWLRARGCAVDMGGAAGLDDLTLLGSMWAELEAEHGDVPISASIGAYLMACRAGAVQGACFFLDRGVPVDLHPPGSDWGGVGHPGLHHAAENGKVALVRALLERGADVTLVDDVFGSTALAWAAAEGREEVVEVLLEAGADPAHTNKYDLTAADLADRNGHPLLAARLR